MKKILRGGVNVESHKNDIENFEGVKKEFSEWADKHLNKIYENDNYEYLGYENPVEIWIAKKLNIDLEKDFLLNQNDIEVTSLIKIFLDKLYSFSISLLSKRNEGDEKNKDNFVYNIDNLYINQEPDLTSFLSIEDQIIFAGKTNKISFLSNDFGSDINLRVINTPELILESDSMVEKILQLDVEEKIDTLENLAKIALEYEFTFYNDSLESKDVLKKPVTEFSLKLKTIIDNVSEKDANPLVSIFAKKFSQRIIERGQRGIKVDSFFEKDKSADYSNDIAGASTMVEVSKEFIAIYDMGNLVPSVILDKETNFIAYEDLYDKKIVFNKDYNSELIRFLHRPEIFIFIENELGLDLREIKLRDQIHFMQFLAEGNEKTFNRLKELFNNSKIDNNKLLKSFLSTAKDLYFGENILSIAENQSEEVTNKIFAKYVEIVDSIDEIEDFLMEEFSQESENNSELIKEISNDLLKKGKDFLRNVSENDDESEIIKTLEVLKTETELFKTVFKRLSECREEGCSLEEAKSLSLDKIEGLDILANPVVASEMKKIYLDNYPDEEDFSEEFRNGLLESFEKKIINENTDFYLVKKDNKIIGFNSFTKKDNYIEFANFNLNRDFKGVKIGKALLDETLFKIGKASIIRAVALKGSGILNHYIEDLGFEIIDDSGKKFKNKEIVEIELDIKKSKD